MATESQRAVTEEQYETFHADGYLIVEDLFADEVEEMRAILEAAAAKPDAHPDVHFESEDLSEAERSDLPALATVRKMGPLDEIPAYLAHFDAESDAARVAAGLLGGVDELRMMGIWCFAKPAEHGSATPWHQDQALWSHWKPTALSCWVALDDCTRENGCLQFAAGTQAEGYVDHVTDGERPHPFVPDDRVAEKRSEGRIEHAVMDAGDAVFFDGTVWHGSDENASGARRLGSPAVYCDAAEWERAYENAKWATNRADVGKSVSMSASFRDEKPRLRIED